MIIDATDAVVGRLATKIAKALISNEKVIIINAGKAIITGLCCNDKNFPASGPAITPGVHINVMEAYDSMQKLKKMADILIPLHDLSIGKLKSIP